jgi:hypothetical protein
LCSGIACILVMASFAVPLWATGYVDEVLREQQADSGISQLHQIIGFIVMFAFYLVNYFVIIFFNSALIACAIIRFKGGNPNLADGFSAATERLPQIFGWALVAATVGLILRTIESRSEKVGQFVVSLLGMAWSAVTYFVVPVIVVEKAGPITAAKRSFEILKRTWGEAVFARFGIGFIVFLGMMLGIIPMVLGGMALASGLAPVGGVLIVVGIVVMLLVSLISSALSSIIIGALYLYAAEGTVPQQFDSDLFQRAFAAKK